ncbi:Cysteine-rich receptor-like protein kinase 25 [Morella rubra]|uniref:Cysteine-rich receptor-like protein kinase 25 n=1 Tax=Morella rubra TaxID=262757 RepID=A0A6A1WXW3_9ROSI|nr:Cysteine-rich receptor-like protein kinase 25 [Morella rubra]
MCRSILPFFFYLSLLHLITPTAQREPYVCYETGNYTSNSTYRANLESLLASMSSNTDIDYGFYNFSAGENSDKVNSIALCRGDRTPDECRTCLNASSYDLLQVCPNQKEAITWYGDCSLRYSHRSIFGVMESSPLYAFYNTANVSDVEGFNQVLRPLLDRLIKRAASGNSTRKFALASVPAPAFQTLYALVECTPDLDELECSYCLVAAQQFIPQCCDGKQGGKYVTPSCDLRYEVYPFYDPAAEAPPPSTSTPSPPQPQQPVLPPSPPPIKALPPTEGKGGNSSRTALVIVVPIVLSGVVIISFCICVFYLRLRKQREEVETVDQIGRSESLQFDFGTIRVATGDFSDANKLGKGGFGFVYKGALPNGKEIAVKRLSKGSAQGDPEFKNEVISNQKYKLNWEMRYKIIEGIARGLLYLHEDSQLRIIHRDLKASNILLDKDMTPKIADFGTARLFVRDQTQGNTNRVVGTYGYMPPEYVIHGNFSVKSDVFSFGVLVLEIVTGRKNTSPRDGENEEGLLSYVWKNWRAGTTSKLVDPSVTSTSPATQIMRCIHVGLLCVQENVANRPPWRQLF